MPINLASPGIVVKEVDLTVGRVDPTSGSVGGLVGPFAQGPVELPTLIGTEQDLLNTFGKPNSIDKQFETWLVSSSFLAYGGSLRVVRADDDNLFNGSVNNVGISTTSTELKIKNDEHYEQLGYDDNTITNVTVAARNPGSWANGLRIGIIDGKADQCLGVTSIGNPITGNWVGFGVTQAFAPGTILPGVGSTSVLDGYLKGIITGVNTDGFNSEEDIAGTIEVKVISHVVGSTETPVNYQPNGLYKFSVGVGSTGSATISRPSIDIFKNDGDVAISRNMNTVETSADWFDKQLLHTSSGVPGTATTISSIKWNSIAERPTTTSFAEARGAKNDELHVIVIDGDGEITGNAGTILEKHLGLSKAKNAEFSAGSPQYWRKYLKNNSNYIFGGGAPSGIVTTGFSADFTKQSDQAWDQNADGIIFGGSGAQNYKITSGEDYGDARNLNPDGTVGVLTTGGLTASVAKLATGYKLFENADNFAVNFLLMGSGNYTKEQTQSLANQIIAVADVRKDSLAFISPYRGAFLSDSEAGSVTINNDEIITENILSFYAPLSSSSYAVFDSGYKYMYDRFDDTFRYVPLNGDVAGTCVRTDITNFPWFSPAGTQRGAILNAVKLTYNPSKSQRDVLYSNRINSVIFSAGSGIVLFGDKTALAKSSAFDRINVRRLFLFLENAISNAAKDQLFEFNDEITRTNFVNIVEPFLRDVQSKRGLQDYVVICDETNNTAAVIDNNEFVADIFIKPARSINFIGLTFVATRTGVAFEEVIGNV
tara:strand:- start:661 stop:2964 length:2304 start_codon:yes stop_codon:yes gene_type:complete